MRHHHCDKAVRRQTVALGHIAGEHAAQRRVGQVVRGVDHQQQNVGGKGVDDLTVFIKVRRAKGQQCKGAKGHGGPEQPGAEFAPAGIGTVSNDAHHRGEEGTK